MKLEYVAATRSVKISFTSKDEDNVDRALLKTHYSYLISGNNAYVLVIRTYAPIFQKQNSLFVPFVCLFRFNTFRFDAVGVYGITSPRL